MMKCFTKTYFSDWQLLTSHLGRTHFNTCAHMLIFQSYVQKKTCKRKGWRSVTLNVLWKGSSHSRSYTPANHCAGSPCLMLRCTTLFHFNTDKFLVNISWTIPNSDYHLNSLAVGRAAQMFSLAACSVLQCPNTAYFICFTSESWLTITLHLHW